MILLLLFLFGLCIIIIVLPHITPFSVDDNEANRGDSVQLSCYVNKGDLPFTFTWLLNGVIATNRLGITIAPFGKKTSVLNIDSVDDIHIGNYSCLVKNRAGTTTYTTELVVKGKNYCLYLFWVSLPSFTKNPTFYLW